MALTFKTPGVHIIEVTPAGPIEGVGTSTAAFIGPAVAGPMRKPTLLASWSQFVDKFGKDILVDGRTERSPHSSFPKRLYMPIAVRGFFDNGGQTAYIVRVGTGVQAYTDIYDRGDESPFIGYGAPTPPPSPGSAAVVFRIQAKKEGTDGNNLYVRIEDDSLGETEIARAFASILSAPAGGNTAVVNTPDDFRPGDIIVLVPPPAPTLPPGTTPTPELKVKITRKRENTLTFDTKLTDDYTDGSVKIPDLNIGDRSFRVLDARNIERGSVIRLAQNNVGEDVEVVNVVLLPPESGGARPGFLTLKTELTNSYSLDLLSDFVNVQTLEFKLIVGKSSVDVEKFEGLSMNPEHSQYYDTIVSSKLIEIRPPSEPNMTPAPRNRPQVIQQDLKQGAEDDVTALEASHFQDGIDTLEQIDDVNILCAPDAADNQTMQVAVQSSLITHCEKIKDRFTILDSYDKDDEGNSLMSKDPLDETGILAQRMSVASSAGRAALYYPRILIQNPEGRGKISVPPSGHLAGIYAKVDSERGVHKAPANVTIQNALGLALANDRLITDAEQGELNIKGINVIRMFPLQGPTVWGARTISDLTAWRYISTRRLFLFVEESIQEGTKWAVFEPNTQALWGKIKRTVTDFLTRVWRDGALFGTTPEDAFYVKVDEELNPDPVRALGQLIIEIGIRVAFPAEFIIFRIGQKVGGAEVTELA